MSGIVPDAKLACDLECGQGMRMIAAERMRRGIAADPHLMEEVCGLTRQHALEFEAPKQIGLKFIRFRELSGFCSRQLSQQFCELPKLHQRCVGIVPKIPLGQGAQAARHAWQES